MTVVIECSEVSKRYKLGVIGAGTLRQDVQRWWAKARGHPDPNIRIGHDSARKVPSGEIWALRDVTFQVDEGEILGLIGRNGAGKSTLLKLLTRVTAPTSGRIRLRGRIASLLEIGTGFHPELTGRDNVYLNGALLGMTQREITAQFDNIVAFSEVGDFIDTPVKRYSSGMYVRLAFSVAAHLECEILLIDEVLAVGDLRFQQKCLAKMQTVARSGRTVLFVSHSTASVRKLCSKVMLIDSGNAFPPGDPGEVIERYLRTVGDDRRSRVGLPDGYIYRQESQPIESDCAVLAIVLTDATGRRVRRVATWDAVHFQFHVWARKHIAPSAVFLYVCSAEGTVLSICSNHDSQRNFSFEPGTQVIECALHKWPFSAGRYSLSVALAVPGVERLWWGEDICTLDVAERDVYDSGIAPMSARYLVALEQSWHAPMMGAPAEPHPCE